MANGEGTRRDELLENIINKLRALFPSLTPPGKVIVNM